MCKKESVSMPKEKKKSTAEKYFTNGKCIVNLTNEERQYLALEPMKPEYESVIYFSTTHSFHKRTIIFYDGNTIVKVVYEEIYIPDGGAKIRKSFTEFDTRLKTDNRTMLLPITSNGKPKKITPTNVLAIIPFGCDFNLMFGNDGTKMISRNQRNNLYLEIGEHDYINTIKSENDFHKFMEWYISTCPENYFDRINEIKTAEHKTIKFSAGDIFRCYYDRTHFCYGLVLGKTREIEKWKELPKEHSFRHMMTQPIMIRMYDFVTNDPNMTTEQLASKPLRPTEICSDNDLIWGTHKIIGHKKLVPDDIQFELFLAATSEPDIHTPPLSPANDFRKKSLFYIEWGFVQFYMNLEKIPKEIMNIATPKSGVNMIIDCHYCGKSLTEILAKHPKHVLKNNLFFPENIGKYQAVMRFFGLPENAVYNDFARKYGGLTSQEFIDKIQGDKKSEKHRKKV